MILHLDGVCIHLLVFQFVGLSLSGSGTYNEPLGVLSMLHFDAGGVVEGDLFREASGSSAISNLADNVINVEKTPTKGIRVTKNRDFGVTGFINTCYDPANRRLFQYNIGDKTIYGWDHNGIKVPENAAFTLEEFKIDDGTQVQPF